MKLGVFCPLSSPAADAAYVRSFGENAERLGFDSLWVAEHVVLFDDYASKYPYSPDGRIPARPTSGVLEPLTSLSYLAAVTKRIRLGTGILLVPQRNPVYTAKEAANVDWLSGGRLDLGVGVGWLAEEFRAAGVPWARRGERTRSYIEVMRRLWCDELSEYKDEFYELPACRQFPKPVQKAGSADPLRRRERRRAAARRGHRPGLVRLQPRARRRRGSARALGPHARGERAQAQRPGRSPSRPTCAR